MKRLPDSTLSTAEACAAFGTVIDAELAEKRRRLAERMRETQDKARHGRFWQGVALRAAADAAIQRAQGRVS